MDEAGLIRAAQRGNLSAFNELVLTYQNVLYAQAYRMIGDAEAAADATQEAFISAYRGIGAYRGGSFKAWLLRIVTNACYDELRRRKRHPGVPLEPHNADEEEIESPHWLEDEAESPEARLERNELGAAIQHCLEALPPEFRAIVILVDIQGMDYREAAYAVGKPVGTVKSRLARARLRLRDCLQASGELLPAQFRLEGEDRP